MCKTQQVSGLYMSKKTSWIEEMQKTNYWLADYFHIQKVLANKQIKLLDAINIKPTLKERQVKRITLKEWIEFLGMPKAAKECNVSEATIKAWRYGYRQPSIEKAKEIIVAAEGRLDYESIFGEIKDFVEI